MYRVEHFTCVNYDDVNPQQTVVRFHDHIYLLFLTFYVLNLFIHSYSGGNTLSYIVTHRQTYLCMI